MKKNHLVLVGACFLTSCAASPKKDQAGNIKPDPPKLLKPVVKKVWIPPEIRNGGAEWVEGHYMYRIDKEVTWSR